MMKPNNLWTWFVLIVELEMRFPEDVFMENQSDEIQ